MVNIFALTQPATYRDGGKMCLGVPEDCFENHQCRQLKILTGTEPTGALRHLPGTHSVAHICFDRGRGAGGGVLWTGRAALTLFQLPP